MRNSPSFHITMMMAQLLEVNFLNFLNFLNFFDFLNFPRLPYFFIICLTTNHKCMTMVTTMP